MKEENLRNVVIMVERKLRKKYRNKGKDKNETETATDFWLDLRPVP